MVLPEVLSFEVLLALSVDGSRQVGDGVPEPLVRQLETVLTPSPAQIEDARLLDEYTSQRRRDGGGLVEVEIAGSIVPGPLTLGDDEQDALGRLRGDPVLELPLYPW
jgi:hypothetical protein